MTDDESQLTGWRYAAESPGSVLECQDGMTGDSLLLLVDSVPLMVFNIRCPGNRN